MEVAETWRFVVALEGLERGALSRSVSLLETTVALHDISHVLALRLLPSARSPGRASGGAPRRSEPDLRFTLANERTFLAWNRTALALIAGGVAGKLLDFSSALALLAVAPPPITLNAALSALSYRRWEAV